MIVCLIGVGSLIIVLLLHVQFLDQLPALINNDTLLTLNKVSALLLVVLTSLASAALILTSITKTRFLQRYRLAQTPAPSRLITAVADLLLTLALIWSSLSLAPQLFYQFYRLIIPGLPAQWVAGVVNPVDLLMLLQLQHATTLAALATGVLLLTMLVSYLLCWVCLPNRWLA